MSIFKKDETLKRRWIEALRSGEYEQVQGVLRTVAHYGETGFRYCCLGVLCDVYDPSGWPQAHGNHPLQSSGAEFLKDNIGLGQHVRLEDVGEVKSLQDILSQMNDDGISFEEIADYIEQNL